MPPSEAATPPQRVRVRVSQLLNEDFEERKFSIASLCLEIMKPCSVGVD
jgi:hypothetical protein